MHLLVFNSLFGDSDSPGVVGTVIPTVGYHTIRLQIDMRVNDLENGEACYIEYRSSSTDWTRDVLARGPTNAYNAFDEPVAIPHDNNYDNQPSFEIRIGIDANSGGDRCYFENLEVFGIPYPTTTLTTTHPSNTQSPITALPTTALSTNAVPTSVSPTTAFPTRTTASKAATIAVHITDPSSESPSVFFFFYY
eukprot:254652_1